MNRATYKCFFIKIHKLKNCVAQRKRTSYVRPMIPLISPGRSTKDTHVRWWVSWPQQHNLMKIGLNVQYWNLARNIKFS